MSYNFRLHAYVGKDGGALFKEDLWWLIDSLVAQTVKRLPTMWETWVWSLGREDPLEKEMATHSSILAWKIPWTEEPGRLQSMESQRVRYDWATSLPGDLIEGVPPKLLYAILSSAMKITRWDDQTAFVLKD